MFKYIRCIGRVLNRTEIDYFHEKSFCIYWNLRHPISKNCSKKPIKWIACESMSLFGMIEFASRCIHSFYYLCGIFFTFKFVNFKVTKTPSLFVIKCEWITGFCVSEHAFEQFPWLERALKKNPNRKKAKTNSKINLNRGSEFSWYFRCVFLLSTSVNKLVARRNVWIYVHWKPVYAYTVEWLKTATNLN